MQCSLYAGCFELILFFKGNFLNVRKLWKKLLVLSTYLIRSVILSFYLVPVIKIDFWIYLWDTVYCNLLLVKEKLLLCNLGIIFFLIIYFESKSEHDVIFLREVLSSDRFSTHKGSAERERIWCQITGRLN